MVAESTTIAALATAPLPAGLAVVRVSGPQAKKALRATFRSKKDPTSSPRLLVFGDVVDSQSGTTIDKAMAVYMPGPNSFTGDDIVEFQFHGSPLLVQKLLRSLFSIGVAPAEPGEFSKRAFLNGKMDLAQAEAIADLINATSERSLRIASSQLQGKLSAAVRSLGEPLKDSLAELEAGIDFPEEDISPAALNQIKSQIEIARVEIKKFIDSFNFGSTIKEGFKILITGRPNAGKSSLLNLFLGSERAIVTPVSGTTRDLIEDQANIHGYRFIFCDSAGITETADLVEKIGIERALSRIDWADLVLLVVDATDLSSKWESVRDELVGRAKNVWLVVNKIDKNPKIFGFFSCSKNICSQTFYISAINRDGFEQLCDALVSLLKSSAPSTGDSSEVITSERHKNCFEAADKALEECCLAIDRNLPPEIVSAELRRGLTALSEIIGETYQEDILGRIFSKFCIGK
jgi:tRNA modification GTPase